MATLLFTKNPDDRKRLLVAVDQYLRDRFIYQDEKIETLLYPEYMLNGLDMTGHLVGDCDDISTLHAALLTCLSYPVRFVAIKSTLGNQNFDHVFIEVNQDGDWIPYDVTIPLGAVIEYHGRLAVQI